MGRSSGGGRRVPRIHEEIEDEGVGQWKRQTLIFNPSNFETASVGIIGLGNIGSQTAVALARLGIKRFELWDDDTVEIHNLSSQSFNTADMGSYKVDASEMQISAINLDTTTIALKKKFNGKDSMADILIIAVDSMDERKKIYSTMKRNKVPFPKLLIDGRMGGPQLEIYTLHSYEEWKDTFCDNPSTDPCGARYICYISMVIGAFISNQVKRFLKGEKLKKEILFNIDTYQLFS